MGGRGTKGYPAEVGGLRGKWQPQDCMVLGLSFDEFWDMPDLRVLERDELALAVYIRRRWPRRKVFYPEKWGRRKDAAPAPSQVRC